MCGVSTVRPLATRSIGGIQMMQPLATDLADRSTMEPLMTFVVDFVSPEQIRGVADDGREAEKLKEASRLNRRLRLSRKKG